MNTEDQYDPQKKMPRREDPLQVITDLLNEKGIERFAAIVRDWEGDTLPGGTPTESGQILTDDGRVFCYWLGWDPDKTAPDGTKGWYTLGENFKNLRTGEPYPLFYEILPDDPQYPEPDNSSFIRAKQKLGLA